MFKFIIVFCVAVFASATYAASLEGRETPMLQDAKKKCDDEVGQTFISLLDGLLPLMTSNQYDVAEMIQNKAYDVIEACTQEINAITSLAGFPLEESCQDMFTKKIHDSIETWISEKTIRLDEFSEEELQLLDQIRNNKYLIDWANDDE